MKSQTGQGLLPGISSLIAATNELIRAAALNDNLVFLTGEIGTEKAFAGKLIHQVSARARFPLTKINVSWKLPPDLASYFSQTDGGTLLIHIQKEFPVDMQYTLIEMASDGSFADPMSGDVISSDVRIIIITSLDIDQLGGRTPLLPELHDLLMSQHIELPPLRERLEDIPALVRYAINRANETGRSKARAADPQVISLFRQWNWPGNVEDLLLVTAQAAIASRNEMIGLDDLPEAFLKQFTPDLLERARAVAPAPTARQSRPITEVPSFGSPDNTPTQPMVMPTLYTLGQSRAPAPPPPSSIAAMSDEPTHAMAAPDQQDTRQTAPPARTPPPQRERGTEEDTQSGGHSDTKPLRGYVPPATLGAEFVLPRVLNLARRLNAQSQLLGKQISGPLASDSQQLIPRKEGDDKGSDEQALKALEKEIDRGLDMVMSLRRQMAMLNMRHQESAETIRDIVQRLSYVSDTETPAPSDSIEVTQDARQLADSLQAIDDIIRRVSNEVPMLTDHLQSTISGKASPDDEDTQQRIFKR